MAFKPKRQQRRLRFLANGFLPFEAFAFSSVPFARAPFMRRMIRDRRELLIPLRREADFMNWSRSRYEKEKRLLIAFEYKDKGLIYIKSRKGIIRIKGRPDPWQLFRYYRDKAIEDGEWPEETPRNYKKKKRLDEHGFRIDKGNLKAQKTRRREREKQRKEREY